MIKVTVTSPVRNRKPFGSMIFVYAGQMPVDIDNGSTNPMNTVVHNTIRDH